MFSTHRKCSLYPKSPEKQRAKGCFEKKPPKNNARKGDFEKSPPETTRERVFWKKVSQKQRAKGHFVFKTMQNVRWRHPFMLRALLLLPACSSNRQIVTSTGASQKPSYWDGKSHRDKDPAAAYCYLRHFRAMNAH